MQNANDQAKVRVKRKAAQPLIDFCVLVAWYQIQNGRFFVIENPLGSQLWGQPGLQELSSSPGVKRHASDLCMYGLRDLETDKYFKKSLGLMTNIPETSLRPLLRRCDDSHQHEIVQGRFSGGLQRTLYTQIYPHRFCIAYAKMLTSLLGSLFDNKRRRDEASWFLTFEDEPYYDDYDQYEFIDDLFELADTTLYEEEALAVVCEDADGGLIEGIEGHCSFATTITSPTRELRTLMSWSDSFPKGAEVSLRNPQSSTAHRLVPYAQAIRKYYLPTHQFQDCKILRGTLGTDPQFCQGNEAWIFMWRKGSKEIDFITASEYVWDQFDANFWTMLVFTDDAGGSGRIEPQATSSTRKVLSPKRGGSDGSGGPGPDSKPPPGFPPRRNDKPDDDDRPTDEDDFHDCNDPLQDETQTATQLSGPPHPPDDGPPGLASHHSVPGSLFEHIMRTQDWRSRPTDWERNVKQVAPPKPTPRTLQLHPIPQQQS